MINSRPLLWGLLALPALPVLADMFHDRRYYPELMFETGLFAIQMLVLTLAISPLKLLLGKWRFTMPLVRWLIARRRYFGVSVFAYSLLHAVVYVRENGDLLDILDRAIEPELLTGWISLAIFLSLALTSNDYSVGKLGVLWKRLHLLVYPAAAAALIHWLYFETFINDVFLLITLLALLQAYRIYRQPRRLLHR